MLSDCVFTAVPAHVLMSNLAESSVEVRSSSKVVSIVEVADAIVASRLTRLELELVIEVDLHLDLLTSSDWDELRVTLLAACLRDLDVRYDSAAVGKRVENRLDLQP